MGYFFWGGKGGILAFCLEKGILLLTLHFLTHCLTLGIPEHLYMMYLVGAYCPVPVFYSKTRIFPCTNPWSPSAVL